MIAIFQEDGASLVCTDQLGGGWTLFGLDFDCFDGTVEALVKVDRHVDWIAGIINQGKHDMLSFCCNAIALNGQSSHRCLVVSTIRSSRSRRMINNPWIAKGRVAAKTDPMLIAVPS